MRMSKINKRTIRKRMNNQKIKRRYSKYQKRSFQRIKGGMFRCWARPKKEEEKLTPIVSRCWSELVCDETVNVKGNGEIIFRDLIEFLDSDPKYYQSFEKPEDYVRFSEKEKRKYIEFYEKNKEWLGCQIYLLLSKKDISSGYAKFDDGNYFFRWLTGRLREGVDPEFFTKPAPAVH